MPFLCLTLCLTGSAPCSLTQLLSKIDWARFSLRADQRLLKSAAAHLVEFWGKMFTLVPRFGFVKVTQRDSTNHDLTHRTFNRQTVFSGSTFCWRDSPYENRSVSSGEMGTLFLLLAPKTLFHSTVTAFGWWQKSHEKEISKVEQIELHPTGTLSTCFKCEKEFAHFHPTLMSEHSGGIFRPNPKLQSVPLVARRPAQIF